MSRRQAFQFAVRHRDFIALIGLLLQERWFSQTILFTARLSSYAIVVLGIALVTFSTVVTVRECTPVLFTPGTVLYDIFHLLAVVISFNILFNYVCATAFSCRLGRGPRREASETRDSKQEEVNASYARPRSSSDVSRASEGSRGISVTVDNTAGEEDGLFDRDVPGVVSSSVCCGRDLHKLVPCLYPCPQYQVGGYKDKYMDAASPQVLHELEEAAESAERLTAMERRYKQLENPRRMCRFCKRLKAPREHHCSICNQCVPKMDHHCPWINACVDAENQRYFNLFVFWLWIGSFLDAGFLGYGYLMQSAYERRLRSWVQQQNRQTEFAAMSSPPVAPYGAQGHKLTSFPVVLAISLGGTMCLCMCFFMVHNTRALLRNTTQIEALVMEEKQKRVFKSTSFVFRNPYDLGAWRNFVAVFRTPGDPVLLWFERKIGGTSAKQVLRLSQHPQPWRQRCSARFRQALVVAWLIVLPTMRSTGCDGIHFPTFDSEVRSGLETAVASVV